MEKVYPYENYTATDPIDLAAYFKTFEAECRVRKGPCEDPFVSRMKVLNKEFDLPLELADVKELEKLCTIDKLNVANENGKLPISPDTNVFYIKETHPITKEGQTLETVKSKEHFNRLQGNLKRINKKLSRFQMCQNKTEDGVIKNVMPGSTFVQKVLVFAPFTMGGNSRLTSDSFQAQYEIEVLGTNTLLDLANVINCVSDSFVIKEVFSSKIQLDKLESAKEKYPSRCFFIENVFYNDLSNPDATDNSEVVRKWAAKKNLGHFPAESMEAVKIDTLKPRFGYGYVYIHQGNCEHIICFSDAKLLQYVDCLDSKKYPIVHSLRRHINNLCFICSENIASWLVIDSDRLPIRKAFFCTHCCESYMFLDGNKVGTFQLYPCYEALSSANKGSDFMEDGDNNWECLEDDECIDLE